MTRTGREAPDWCDFRIFAVARSL